MAIDNEEGGKAASNADEHTKARLNLRMKKREEWAAYWKVMDMETRGHLFYRMQYYWFRSFDAPATWWRENVVEPLQDRFGHWPYYHRRFKRVPTVDECHVNDAVCYYEAQMQYKLDKLVDNKILTILRNRRDECFKFHGERSIDKCMHQAEDAEEAELNHYIKYGELGLKGDALTCYMKQKHRMIWERRHPEIMAEREAGYKEHKRLLNLGIYDHWFWKRANMFNFKEHEGGDMFREKFRRQFPFTEEEKISLNPEYYKKREEAEQTYAKPWQVYP